MSSTNQAASPSPWLSPWLACLLFGLGVLALGPYLLSIFPATGANHNSNYGTPIFAFEFARSHADLLAIFGDKTDLLREQRLAAMDAGHYLDFVFAVLYAGFLACFFIGIRTVVVNPVYRWVTMLCVVAGLADIIENIILLDISKNIDDPEWLPYLIIPVQIKFISLTIASIASSWLLLSRQAINHGKVFWRLLGALGLVAVLSVIPGLAMPAQFGYLVGNGYTIAWVSVLLYAAVQVWDQRRSN